MQQRAMGYGRYSDEELQKKSSITDQRRNFEAYVQDRGLKLAGFHGDEGISGGTMARPGLRAVMEAVSKNLIDVLVIEDVDRLGRDQEHLQNIKKLLVQYDVKLHTLEFGGEIPDLLFSFKGIFSEQHRASIRYWTRRGLTGKAAVGGFTGGRVMGYVREITTATGRAGSDRYSLEPTGVEIVRKIFRMYDEGMSLTAICKALDEAGIPAPNSSSKRVGALGKWSPSTLSGNVERGEGILNNEIYIGRLIFNRRKYIEIPDGKGGILRRPRLNPVARWVIVDAEELRIIPQELWSRVKERQRIARDARDVKFKLSGNPLSGAKRPAHLLSGLITCGTCSQPYVAFGGGRWRCRGTKAAGCSNGSITGLELEQRVLAGISDRLLEPELISRFALLFQEELSLNQQERGNERIEIRKKLADVRDSTDRLVHMIEGEERPPKSLLKRILELEEQEVELNAILAKSEEPDAIQVPANYHLIYETAVADLGSALSSVDASYARECVRALIEAVIVLPGNSRGGKRRNLKLRGDLFEMLDFAANVSAASGAATVKKANAKLLRHKGGEGVVTALVAGTGFEPVTFRL